MPLILPGNVGSATAATGFNVANSCRFNSASSDRLNRTLGTPTNNLKWTYSFWIKRSKLGEEVAITEALTDSQNKGIILFRSDDKLEILDLISDSYVMQKKTNRVFRDTASWYHIVFSNDSTAGSPDLKIYVNGVEETSLATDNEYSQNQAGLFNSALANHIGASASSRFSNCYFSEFVFIDGLQLAADQFGEFDSDSGIWKPIDVSGLTFGTNGFYLDFEDSSALGNDAAGSNNFTVNNLTAVDQSTDTCTNNMPTINQLTLHSNGVTVSEGSLVATTGDAPWQSTNCTFGLTTGKWYWEFKATESSTNQYLVLGIQSDNLLNSAANGFGYSNNYSYGFKNYNGEFVYNESDGGGSGSYGNAVTDGQIIGVALDLVNLEIYFSINGTYQNSGDPTSGSSGTGSAGDLQSGQTYFPSLVIARAGGTGTIPIGEYNFGSPPYSESGGNSDGAGYGNFATAPPSGYFSINSKNLAEYGG